MKPNILIVMTDHQRADVCLPEHPCITPNLDKVIKEGVTFTEAFTPMAHCCPARASFFSGLMPSRHGVWNNVNNAYAINRGPFADVEMFSSDLKSAGYDLRYTGKWHVSARGNQTPVAYGWQELDEYGEVFADENAAWERVRERAEDKIPEGESVIGREGYTFSSLYGEKEDAWATDRATVETAIEALEDLGASKDPWCLYVGICAPHSPYNVDKKYLDMYDLDSIPLPESFHDEMEDKPEFYRELKKNYESLGEEGTRDAIRHFWALCTKIDDWFGMLMDKLEEKGMKEDTLVLFCSDHGDYTGDHGLFQKQIPAFLGAYKIPAIISWPKGIKNPGRRVDEFVSLTDFAPTFLDIAELKTERYFSGKSLLPFLEDKKTEKWRDDICTQCEGTEKLFTQRMVVTKDYKYVYNSFCKDEFYDLKKDPHEMTNLFGLPEHEEDMLDMVGRMWEHAYLEQDQLGSVQSMNVNTAPRGPKEAFLRAKRQGREIPKAHQNPNLSKED
jgi:arylsulfatase A-like enzyme